MAEHLICNQEVVGSTPTAGSSRTGRGTTRHTAGSAGPARPEDPPAARRAAPWKRDASRMTRERSATVPGPRRRGAAPASGPSIANPRAGRRLHACGAEPWGRFQSGQMGQTVNLVATPSAVRIRLSPPAPRAGGDGATDSVRPTRRDRRCIAVPLPVIARRCLPADARARPLERRLRSAPGAEFRGGRGLNPAGAEPGGRSSMVEPQPSKLMAWVRFPSPAPAPLPPQLVARHLVLEPRHAPPGVHPAEPTLPTGAPLAGPGPAGCCSSVVEHFLGKEEVMGSSPHQQLQPFDPPFRPSIPSQKPEPRAATRPRA